MEDAHSQARSTASSRNMITVLLFCACTAVYGMMFTVMGAFFPVVVNDRGLSSTVTGFILCTYELVAFVNGPIVGAHLTKIGSRFTFLAGLFASGYCCVLFAFMDRIPNNTTFVVFCFLVRTVQAVGGSSMMTASFALVANTYPERVTTLFAILEMAYGVGMITGYPLGGWLYHWGGFRLPFLVPGVAVVLLTAVMFFALSPASEQEEPEHFSMVKFLRSIYVMILCYFLIMSAACETFFDVSLSLVLKQRYSMNPFHIGLVFVANAAAYSIFSVIIGYVNDKRPSMAAVYLVVGFVINAIGFLLMGPMPLLGISSKPLWLMIFALFLSGTGYSAGVVVVVLLNEHAERNGFPEGLATDGLVAGIYNAALSLGGFVGPLGGGYLIDVVAFDWTTTIFAALTVFGLFLFIVYHCVHCCRFGHSMGDLTAVNEEQQGLIQRGDASDM